MEPERWRRVAELFEGALNLVPEERHNFLTKQCEGDNSLLREVISLLEADEGADQFIGDLDLRPDSTTLSHSWVGKTVGRYRILEVVGEGGMSAVYLGSREDEEYESKVAVKIMRAEGRETSLLPRFRRERQILANLKHPNIATLYGRHHGRWRPLLIFRDDDLDPGLARWWVRPTTYQQPEDPMLKKIPKQYQLSLVTVSLALTLTFLHSPPAGAQSVLGPEEIGNFVWVGKRGGQNFTFEEIQDMAGFDVIAIARFHGDKDRRLHHEAAGLIRAQHPNARVLAYLAGEQKFDDAGHLDCQEPGVVNCDDFNEKDWAVDCTLDLDPSPGGGSVCRVCSSSRRREQVDQ